MTTTRQSFAITGANGYLGTFLVKFLRDKGHRVIKLGRNLSPNEKEVYPYHLGETVSPDFLREIDTLIHCAYDFSAVTKEEIFKSNVGGSIKLFNEASQAGVPKIVFISSMSAFPGCLSLYGQGKLEVEKKSAPLGVISIRPGMIYDESPKGIVGIMDKIVHSLPLIPLIGKGDQPLFFCHVEDLAHLVLEIAEGRIPRPVKPIIAAHPSGKTFQQMFEILANRRQKKVATIPCPAWIPWLLLKTLEKIGLRLRLKSDNVVSLTSTLSNPDFTSLHPAGTQFRAFT
ncbi:MAG: NAD(P)-dependent oxidoreductase [Deltaproteobacteria bacterium]|nr:NAD(P)-dependent oxidoreductase [Deltaproteobacteria bacterium]